MFKLMALNKDKSLILSAKQQCLSIFMVNVLKTQQNSFKFEWKENTN